MESSQSSINQEVETTTKLTEIRKSVLDDNKKESVKEEQQQKTQSSLTPEKSNQATTGEEDEEKATANSLNQDYNQVEDETQPILAPTEVVGRRTSLSSSAASATSSSPLTSSTSSTKSSRSASQQRRSLLKPRRVSTNNNRATTNEETEPLTKSVSPLASSDLGKTMSTLDDIELGEGDKGAVTEIATGKVVSSSDEEESATAPSVTKAEKDSPGTNKSEGKVEKSGGGGDTNEKKWIRPALIATAAVAVVAVVIAVPVALTQRSTTSPDPTPVDDSPTPSGSDGPFLSQSNRLLNRFPEVIPNVNQRNVMAGYESCDDLLMAVQHALESMANSQIESGRDRQCWWNPNGPWIPPEQDQDSLGIYPCPMMEATASFAGNDVAAAGASAPSPSSTADSYETNNQVDGVDEADIVKSNGEFVFMGYGSEVIVIDLDGNVLDRVDVPLPPNATQLQPGFGEENISDGGDGDTAIKSSFIGGGGWGCGGPPKAQYRTVKSLLMEEDTSKGTVTLNVITTFDDWQCQAALCGGLTTAFVYEFNTQARKLSLLASQDINGSYNNARGIGSVNHIVTNARIDTWGFIGPLYRCDQTHYWNTTYEEYEKKALEMANRTVAEYAQKIVDGLSWADPSSATGNSCKHVVQISTMTTGDEELSLEEKRKLRLFDESGVLQNFVQITSLDVTSVTSPAAGVERNETLGTGLGTVESKVAGAFMAYYRPELYSTATDLILAGRGWRYDTSGNWDQHTFLMSFNLTSTGTSLPGAVPIGIGEVPGYLKDQFSMDLFNEHLRVATTNSQRWGRVEIVDEETGDLVETNWVVTTNSTSQVTVLKENGNGSLERVGVVDGLGEGEEIKSVRFIGDRGYVVTFRTIDPLYSLDLSIPTEPKMMGELKITGFSEYMHPISNSDDPNSVVGDYLLTVGKEADETDGGRLTGTKISVFDVRDITEPTLVGDYVLDNSDRGWSGSDATLDHHAFRYVPDDSKLIIPLYMYDWTNPTNNFDGFVVYNVNVTSKEITVTGNVTHSEGQRTMDWCWGRASLPSRSMVFKGDLMTFKSHSIKMTNDINNLGGDVWNFGELNLDENRTKDDDCFGYWPWMPFF